MGALNDITLHATNSIKCHSRSSTSYRSLNSPGAMDKENVGKTRSPHFMTPTLSSFKQSLSKNVTNDRTSSPVPLETLDPETSNAWMKSAAKRVGLRRVKDGTPRATKDTPSQHAGAANFPDKV